METLDLGVEPPKRARDPFLHPHQVDEWASSIEVFAEVSMQMVVFCWVFFDYTPRIYFCILLHVSHYNHISN
jgi:hypothetical protein